MKKWRHFYRKEYVCIVEQISDSQEYVGHIGFKKSQKFYKSIFAEVGEIRLYRMINNFKFNNKSLDSDNIWWLSFKPLVSYDRQKIINILKNTVDALSESAEIKKKHEGFKFL